MVNLPSKLTISPLIVKRDKALLGDYRPSISERPFISLKSFWQDRIGEFYANVVIETF
jgi:hypothetical protein